MPKRISAVLVLGLVALFAFAGCSDDATVPIDDTSSNTGLVRGDINPASGGFEITSESGGDPADPIAGPFMIRGANIRYDDGLGALLVDLTVINAGTVSHPEPIGLTFINLLPGGVTVLNPDNDEHGPGAAITFQFDNDDNLWTPGEESLPHTVQLGVDAGTSVGFVARIDIGMDTTRGSIGGIAWWDKNENGEMDDDEAGLPGVGIFMTRIDGPEDTLVTTPPETLWQTVTGNDGTYRFDDLDAGVYEVHKALDDKFRPTTPTVIHVILVEVEGEVSDFLMANFGCIPLEVEPPPVVEIGDFAAVTGTYGDDPDPHVEALGIDVWKCNAPPDPMTPTGDGHGPLPPCFLPFSEMRGPVTDINLEESQLAVMGTWIAFPPDTIRNDTIPVGDSAPNLDRDDDRTGKWLHLEDIEIGDRVRVRTLNVDTFADGPLLGLWVREWNGDKDQVFGIVGDVKFRPESIGMIEELLVLRSKILVTDQTEIHFKYWYPH